jgi:hypothetical protein
MRRIIPRFRAQRYLPAGVELPVRGRPIALADLATHTAGLPRLPHGFVLRSVRHRCDAYAWLTVEDLYAGLPSTPLRREPGGRPRYSTSATACSRLRLRMLSRVRARPGLLWADLVGGGPRQVAVSSETASARRSTACSRAGSGRLAYPASTPDAPPVVWRCHERASRPTPRLAAASIRARLVDAVRQPDDVVEAGRVVADAGGGEVLAQGGKQVPLSGGVARTHAAQVAVEFSERQLLGDLRAAVLDRLVGHRWPCEP